MVTICIDLERIEHLEQELKCEQQKSAELDTRISSLNTSHKEQLDLLKLEVCIDDWLVFSIN